MPPKGLGPFKQGYGAASAIAKAAAKPQRMQARRNKRVGVRATNKAYGALDRTFQDIANDAAPAFRQAGLGFSRGLSGLAGMLNVAGGGIQGITGAGAFGDIAASGMRGLAQHRTADISNLSRYRSQAGIERKNTVLNLVDEFRQEMSQIAAQQAASAAQMTPGLQESLWGREQDLWEREQAEEAAAKEREYAEWLVEALRKLRGGGGGGRGGGGQYAPAYMTASGQYAPHEAYGMDLFPHLQGPGYDPNAVNPPYTPPAAAVASAPRAPVQPPPAPEDESFWEKLLSQGLWTGGRL